MKIKIEQYNPAWKEEFKIINEDLNRILGFLHPKIEHVGSTSVEGLSAKPIIDILIGLDKEDDLDKVVKPLMDNDYIYYEIYNQYLPDRRFFVKHKINAKDLSLPRIFRKNDSIPAGTVEHDARLAHIHVWPISSGHWTRHIAFRDYLRYHPAIREEYQKLKEQLSIREWVDGNEYNEAKDAFIKEEERKALEWYEKLTSGNKK